MDRGDISSHQAASQVLVIPSVEVTETTQAWLMQSLNSGCYWTSGSMPFLRSYLRIHWELRMVLQDLKESEPEHPKREWYESQLVLLEEMLNKQGATSCTFQSGEQVCEWGFPVQGSLTGQVCCIQHAPRFCTLEHDGFCPFLWGWKETGKCEQCGERMEREDVDVGVGKIYGPWRCVCGYDEREESLLSFPEVDREIGRTS
jgi:hypothetical protein